MARKITIALISILALLLLASCLYDDTYGDGASYAEQPGAYSAATEPTAREQLAEMGWTDEWIDALVEDGVDLESMVNQLRFFEITDRISTNEPVGPSGEVIAERYFGGLHYNDDGILVVQVLEAAFSHTPSATAIEEIRELGIIVNTVEFSNQDLLATLDALSDVHEKARDAGATSWGLGARNRIEVWLDPYTEEQIAIFMDFIQEHSISPAMIIITPAVSPEMYEHRAALIAAAAASSRDQIVHVGEVEISLTGISFTLENRTDYTFVYGAPWDLAYYSNGEWVPVTHLPGAGGGRWTMQAYHLQGGGIQNYRQEWSWRFGELPSGRYMFIRDGHLGEWDRNSGRAYAVVEFYITDDTPKYLPPAAELEWQVFINIIMYRDITPYGMTVLIENTSSYDIDHRAQILFVVPERYTASGYWWEWHQHHIPLLPTEGYWEDYFIHGIGFISSGGQLEFTLNWEAIFGQLPPGEYIIALDLGGQAHPPHPTGWAFGETQMISFTIE